MFISIVVSTVVGFCSALESDGKKELDSTALRTDIDRVAAREKCQNPDYSHAKRAKFFSGENAGEALIFSCTGGGTPLVIVDDSKTQPCPSRIEVESGFEIKIRPNRKAFKGQEHLDSFLGISRKKKARTSKSKNAPATLSDNALIVCQGEDCGIEELFVCHNGVWRRDTRD